MTSAPGARPDRHPFQKTARTRLMCGYRQTSITSFRPRVIREMQDPDSWVNLPIVSLIPPNMGGFSISFSNLSNRCLVSS